MFKNDDMRSIPSRRRSAAVRLVDHRRVAAVLVAAVLVLSTASVSGAQPVDGQHDGSGSPSADDSATRVAPQQGRRQVGAVRRAGEGAELISAAEIGRGVAREVARHDRGWGDSVGVARMIVRGAGGTEVEYRLRVERFEGIDRHSKLVVIEEPGAGNRLAVLSHAHGDGTREQWTTASGGDDVRPIEASLATQRLLDSEFTYEDLAAATVDSYSYRWLRDETTDGIDLVVLERRPAHDGSAYARQVLWIDRDAYRVWRIDFYDRDGELSKTLRLMNYRQYRGAHWRPRIVYMANHRTGASTMLHWDDYRFQTGLQASDFDARRLTRLR